MRITASAPGKTILMGEHAAVYNRPALVAAVDRRLTVELNSTERVGVYLELPEVGVSETLPWDAIQDYASTARERWLQYKKSPDPEAFRRLRGDDPAHLVKVALGESATWAGTDQLPGLKLRLRSEIPIGGGFGSSAAVASAVAKACLELLGVAAKVSDLEHLGLEIERRQHGMPSGIDTATVIHGGLVWAVRDPDGTLSATPVTLRSPELHKIRILNSGTPIESTGEVVAAVRAHRDADRTSFERRLDRMEMATHRLRQGLESETAGDLLEPIREFEACLEEVGVVPPALREIVRQVESRGGAAKISGAGALSGTGAGSLLVYHPESSEIDGWSFLDRLESLDVRLGAEGVRLEVRNSMGVQTRPLRRS